MLSNVVGYDLYNLAQLLCVCASVMLNVLFVYADVCKFGSAVVMTSKIRIIFSLYR